jgi:L-threonylcarbamoyladenylate synthase
VRFPKHTAAQALLNSLDFPLAAPSANLFGKVSPTNAQDVIEQFGDSLDYILDGGQCEVGLESTIIDLSTLQPKVLRLGGLSLEELENCLGEKIAFTKNSSSNPKAPGMLSAHYSPGIPVLFGHLSENLKKVNRKRCGSISFCKAVAGISEENQRILSRNGDLKEAAAKLFSSLRSFKKGSVDLILAEEFPSEGLGRANNDRLKRASAS